MAWDLAEDQQETGPPYPSAARRLQGILACWVILGLLLIGVSGCGTHSNGAHGFDSVGSSNGPAGSDPGDIATTFPNWYPGGSPTSYPSTYPWWAGPTTTFDPRQPAGNSGPPQFIPSSTVPGQRYPGWPGQSSIPGAQTTPTQQSVPVPEFESFACTVTVTPYSGSGSSRKVLISVSVSTAEISTVWVQSSWGDSLQTGKVNLNPVGQAQFPLAAPGTKWPTAAVFAMSDLRPNSQMCAS